MKNQFCTLVSLLVILVSSCKETKPKEAEVKTPSGTATPAPVEFADTKYVETIKNALSAMTNGDVPGWMAPFADNAVYVWNNGDSIAGKEAITQYWTKRRTESVDSISFTNQIHLPIKVNTPQSLEAPGIWVLTWYTVSVKYKPSGKKMSQWSHVDNHFNTNNQIDRVIQYLDNVPIMTALKK